MNVRPIRFFAAACAALALPPALAQAPCHGPVQVVPTLHDEARTYWAGVAGENALAVVRGPSPGGSPGHFALVAYRRDPVSERWHEVQSQRVIGPLEHTPRAMAGRFAVFLLGDYETPYTLTVFEVDDLTGTWHKAGEVSYTCFGYTGLTQLAISPEGRVAYTCSHAGQIWEPSSSGWVQRATFSTQSQFAFDGTRLAVANYGPIDVHRRTAAGAWELEVTLPITSSSAANRPYHIEGDRLWEARPAWWVFAPFATWRLFSAASGTTVHVDGVTQGPFSVGSNPWPAVSHGTVVGLRSDLPCTQQVGAFQLVSVGSDEVPAITYTFCPPALPADPATIAGLAYDGRTLVWATNTTSPQPSGPRTSLYFLPLLAADIDRDVDCVEDLAQIASNPSLDRNTNGRLDSTEARGTSLCVPSTPQANGAYARLAVVGTEGAASSDLIAVASQLAAGAVVLPCVARPGSPLPAAQSGSSGLCLGGPTFGRYAPRSADAAGVAVTSLNPAALPSPAGSVAASAGETWAWQCLFRDIGGTRATNAVAVTLR